MNVKMVQNVNRTDPAMNANAKTMDILANTVNTVKL